MVSNNLRDELGSQYAADFESMNAASMEEFKGNPFETRPAAPSNVSVYSEEELDTFDGMAAQLGKVNLQ